MNKIVRVLITAVMTVFLFAGVNSCIITDMNGGLLLEWDDNDLSAPTGDEPYNIIIENYAREQIFVAVEITEDYRDQPDWNNPMWDSKVNKDSTVILDIDSATNRYVWVYAKTLGTDQKTGQGSIFYEGDNRDKIYVSIHKSSGRGN